MMPAESDFVYRRSAEVTVNYGFYLLMDSAGDPPDPATSEGFLSLGQSAGGALVRTGTFWGPVHITVEIHEEEPPPEASGWEECFDAVQHTRSGTVALGGADNAEQLPVYESEPGSRYHIRIYASGHRETRGETEPLQVAAERHLIQMWPC
jgi:hypothetical protein